MSLTYEQRRELIDKLIDEVSDRCREDPEYMYNVIWEFMHFDDWTEEQLLQQHVEYFGDEYESEEVDGPEPDAQ